MTSPQNTETSTETSTATSTATLDDQTIVASNTSSNHLPTNSRTLTDKGDEQVKAPKRPEQDDNISTAASTSTLSNPEQFRRQQNNSHTNNSSSVSYDDSSDTAVNGRDNQNNSDIPSFTASPARQNAIIGQRQGEVANNRRYTNNNGRYTNTEFTAEEEQWGEHNSPGVFSVRGIDPEVSVSLSLAELLAHYPHNVTENDKTRNFTIQETEDHKRVAPEYLPHAKPVQTHAELVQTHAKLVQANAKPVLGEVTDGQNNPVQSDTSISTPKEKTTLLSKLKRLLPKNPFKKQSKLELKIDTDISSIGSSGGLPEVFLVLI